MTLTSFIIHLFEIHFLYYAISCASTDHPQHQVSKTLTLAHPRLCFKGHKIDKPHLLLVFSQFSILEKMQISRASCQYGIKHYVSPLDLR